MSGTEARHDSKFGVPSARLAPPRLGPDGSRLTPRQRAVLEDLERIFVDEGFAHVTVGGLAARLRCSRRTLYELAPTKDELVLVVLDRRLRRTGALAADALASIDDPAERLEAFMLAGSSELKRASLRFREDVASFPAAQRLFASHYKYATSLVGEIIDDGIRRGRFRPINSQLAAEIIDAALERIQDPELLRSQDSDFETALEELTTLLRYGLAVSQSS